MWMFLAFALCSAVAAQSCQDGFFSHGGSCYLIPAMLASWAEAKVYCQLVGADLAVVDSADEENVLVNYLSLHSHAYRGRYFWLDGVDFVQEGKWEWARSRQPVNVSFWAPHQPDNYGGVQHCLAADSGKSHGWADFKCSNQFPFVCEQTIKNPNPVASDTPIVG